MSTYVVVILRFRLQELLIYLMRFSSYDAAFQRKLVDAYRDFDPSASPPKGRAATSTRQRPRESSAEVESEEDD